MNEGYIKLIKAIFGFQPISIPPYEQFEITDEEKIVSACDKAIESLGDKQKKALYDVIFEGKEKNEQNKYDLEEALIALRHPKISKSICEYLKKVEY